MKSTDRILRDGWLSADDLSLAAMCSLDFHKASGNGGQKVNKTSSAVRVVHLETGISAVSSESRSQLENRKHALSRLRINLAFELRSEPDPGFRIGETPVSMNHAKYPCWLASLLDVFTANSGDLKKSADALGCGTSRLVKLFFRDPKLWTCVQNIRQSFGLPPLRTP